MGIRKQSVKGLRVDIFGILAVVIFILVVLSAVTNDRKKPAINEDAISEVAHVNCGVCEKFKNGAWPR